MRTLSLALLLVACTGDEPEDTDEDTRYRPTLVCPGDAGCAVSEDTTLYVGASSRSIVPDCYETWTDANGNLTFEPAEDSYADCGCDRLCPDDDGYPGPDTGEADGVFHAIYMAGGDSNRPIMGVRGAEDGGLRAEGDGLFAKAIVLRQGETTVAIVAIESIGLQYDDTLATRALFVERGLDVDHLLIHSTHSHLSVDSIGIWGPGITETGYNAAYFEQVRGTIADAVSDAVAALEPVTMTVGEVDVSTYSVEKGVANVVVDTRDPFIVDPMLGAVRFEGADGTVASVVSYGVHPETMLDRTAMVSSDFVHSLRMTVQDGVEWDTYTREGIGGTCIYLNSTVGGMMTTLRLTNTDPDGNEWGSSGSWEKADAIGQQLGEMALDAMAGGETVTEPLLSVRTQQFYLKIENRGFQTMGLLGIMARTRYNYDVDAVINEDNEPEVFTEVDLIQIGPLQLLSIPGELLPELAIGGYDGSFVNAPGRPLVEGTDNPPNLDSAPEGPYIKDEMQGSYRWIVGLGNDEIGYIIPRYNFILSESSPYINEAPGDHYEETRSLGPSTAEAVQGHARAILDWRP